MTFIGLPNTCVSFVLLWAGFVAPRLSTQDSTQSQVLRADDRRFAAMMRGDTASLDSILAPDLSYMHTTGEQQSRTEFLRTIASGELRYKSIVPTVRTVRLLGAAAAAVVGRSNMQVEVGGEVRQFTIRYVAVYEHSAGGWRLVVWQSTRLPT